MNEDLQQLLLNLKLRAIATHLDEYLGPAEREATPFATVFAQLLRAEWQARQQAALAARLKRAHLPETWTLETFPFKIQTSVKERQIALLPNSASSPRRRTSCSSARPVWAKPD